MKKWGVTLCAILLLSPVRAQNWCAPGATWTYGMQASWGEGYYELSYAGDTLLGGMIGQNIDGRQHFHHYDVDSVIDGATFYYFTTHRDTDIVWWWDPDELTWDTLYWFGAAPGEKWLPPNWVGVCPPYEWIEVVDTGTVILSGVALRYCDVVQAGEFDTLYSRITERLGWEWEMNIWPPCAIGPASAAFGLRCYSDVEISWSNPDWGFGCYSMVGILENVADRPSLFPNPGSGHFTLHLPPGHCTIEILDALGRYVHREHISGEHNTIDTRDLPSGTYFVRVWNDRGPMPVQRWVKE